jgi:hypothetical protein
VRVKLEVSPDSEVEVETDADGNVISVEFTPLFAGRNAQAVLAYGVAKSDKGKVLDRFSLAVSGVNGRVLKKSRTGAVKAQVDEDEGEETPHERRQAE